MEKPEPQTRTIEQPTELLLEQRKERPAQQPRSKKIKLEHARSKKPKEEPTVIMHQKTMLSKVLYKAPSHSGKMLKEPTLNRHDRETQYRKEIIFATTQKSCHSRKS